MSKRYDFPLTDWISIGLNRSSLEHALKSIKNNESIDETTIRRASSNRRYIEKVLREEVIKQFPDSRRPFLEVILNSIDAVPAGAKNDYVIKTRIKKGKVTTEDNGTGMNLDEILRLLVIPFSTDKSGFEEIGKFGVGFLSTLNFCVADPSYGLVRLNSRKGDEKWRLDFYSKDDKVENIRLCMRRGRRKQGTKVEMYCKTREEYLKDYLNSYLRGVPSFKARININGEDINVDPKHNWYCTDTEFNVLEKKVKMPVGIQRQADENIQLTLQGVLVKKFEGYGTRISFPPAVQVVEGRDDFKKDNNYNSAVNGVFKSLERCILEEVKSDEETLVMLDLVPQLAAAFGITRLKNVPNIKSITQALVPEKKYAVYYSSYEELKNFFGASMKDVFPVRASSHTFWREIFPGYDELLKEIPLKTKTIKTDEFRKMLFMNSEDYPNIRFLAQMPLHYYSKVHLVELPHQGNKSMYTTEAGTLRELYINLNHRDVTGEFRMHKMYSAMSDLLIGIRKRGLTSETFDGIEIGIRRALENSEDYALGGNKND